jgi:hypothetical protein
MSFAYPGGEDPAYGMEELRALRESGRMFRKANGTGGCHVCGARFRYGSVFEHVSGEYIVVGWECAETIDCAGALGDSRAEVLSALRTTRAKIQRRGALRAWVREAAPEVRRALSVGRGDRIVADIRARLIQWGSLSESQAALVLRLAAKATAPAEVKVPAPEGKRVAVRGKLVSIKVHDSAYGSSLRMTVKVTTDAGVFLVWATLPKSLAGAEVGQEVAIVADLVRSDRDPAFAFAKRPVAVPA